MGKCCLIARAELLLPVFGCGSGAGSWFEPRNVSCLDMCAGRRPALPRLECCAKCPAKQRTGDSSVSAVGCEESACLPLSRGASDLCSFIMDFLPDSGLAAHPGQTHGTPIPARGHRDAAHHGERAPSAGREAPAPAPLGAAPAVLRGSRYPLVSAQPHVAEGSGVFSH